MYNIIFNIGLLIISFITCGFIVLCIIKCNAQTEKKNARKNYYTQLTFEPRINPALFE